MNNHKAPQGSIVVGIDGSRTGERALDWALDDATRRHLSVHVVHAYVRYPRMTAELPTTEDDLQANAEHVVGRALERAAGMAPGVRLTSEVHPGSAARYLVDASAHADSIVVGTHGRHGLARVFLGSTASQVAAYARCPVVVVRTPTQSVGTMGGRVVVGVDGTKVSRDAIGYAFAQAAAREATLTAVHAWWLEYGGDGLLIPLSAGEQEQVARMHDAMVSEAIAEWAGKFPEVQVNTHVARADAFELLVEESADAELLVVGSRGRGGFTGLLLGSVSQHVIQLATCPVAVVRTQPVNGSH